MSARTMREAGTGSLLRAGAVAALVAAVANLLVYYAVPALFGFELAFSWQGPGSEAARLPAFMVVMTTVLAAIGATAVLAIVRRLSRRPVAIFRGIAAAVLLLSFGGPLSQGAAPAVTLTLLAMHILAAAAITYFLTSSTALMWRRLPAAT
jgi:hypothetical protein